MKTSMTARTPNQKKTTMSQAYKNDTEPRTPTKKQITHMDTATHERSRHGPERNYNHDPKIKIKNVSPSQHYKHDPERKIKRNPENQTSTNTRTPNLKSRKDPERKMYIYIYIYIYTYTTQKQQSENDPKSKNRHGAESELRL